MSVCIIHNKYLTTKCNMKQINIAEPYVAINVTIIFFKLKQSIINNKHFVNFIVSAKSENIIAIAEGLKQKWKEKMSEMKDTILKEAGVNFELLKAVGPINVRNLPIKLWQHLQILPERIRAKIVKSIQDFLLNILVDAATGIAINLLANYVYPPIRKMPIRSRLYLRFTLFSLPFGGTYLHLAEKIKGFQRKFDIVFFWMKIAKKIKQAKEFLT